MISIGVLCADVIPPTVSSFVPANSSSQSGTITISCTATDNDKVATVQFKIDGVNQGSAQTTAPFQITGYDTHLLAAGAHTFTVVATDRVGNITTVNNSVTITNSVPSSGDVSFGEWEPSDGGGGYITASRTQGPDFSSRYSFDFIWSVNEDGTGNKSPKALPSNPDSTHYQMYVQFGIDAAHGRIEGGSSGNHIHIYMQINGGTEYDSYDNSSPPNFGPSYFGPVVAVNGGDTVLFTTWETSPGVNTSFKQGVVAHYTFAIKGGYAS